MENSEYSSSYLFEISPPLPPQPPCCLPDQLSQIQPKIYENNTTLTLLKKQLSWLRDTVKKAETRIKEYESYNRLLQYHALRWGSSTIKDLPPEVLAIIFQFCSADTIFKTSILYPFNFDKSPWILSWVCSAWRQVAIKSPELWTAMPGPIELSKSYISTGSLNILRATLERCHHSRTRAFFYLDTLTSGRCLPSLVNIAPHLSQIQELSFVCTASEGLKRLFSLPELPISEAGLASLESLTFGVRYGGNGEQFTMEGTTLPPLFQKMPKLRHMSIISPRLFRIQVPLCTIEFPWRQLTSIAIHGADMREVCGILCVATLLQEFKASDLPNYIQGEAPPLINRFVHSNLQLLHLHCQFRSNMYDVFDILDQWGDLLDKIDMPRLSNLSIKHYRRIKSATIVNLLERSQCSLSELAFSPAVDSISSMLRSCNDVKKLIIGGPFDDKDLNLFKQPYEGQWLVSRLEQLTLLSSRVVDADALNDLIQARVSGDGVQGIHRIELRISPIRALVAVEEKDDSSSSLSSDDVTYPDDEVFNFSERCRSLAKSVLRSSCGYDLVNNSTCMTDLDLLCNETETFQYTPVIHKHILEWKGLLSPLLKIYTHLGEIEDIGPSGDIAFGYKQRLKQVLRLWTHDPWLFESPPLGWTRSDVLMDQDSEPSDFEDHELLSYVAA